MVRSDWVQGMGGADLNGCSWAVLVTKQALPPKVGRVEYPFSTDKPALCRLGFCIQTCRSMETISYGTL